LSESGATYCRLLLLLQPAQGREGRGLGSREREEEREGAELV